MLDRLGLATVGDGPFPYPFVDRQGALTQNIMPDCTINPLRVTPLIRSSIFQPEHAGCRVWRHVLGVLNNTRLAAFVVAPQFNNYFLCSVAVTFSSLVQRAFNHLVGDVFCDAAHPDFREFKDRLENRQKLTALLDAVLSKRTTAEWLSHFAGHVPAAPVNDVAAALDNPFVRQGGRIWNITHPTRADFRMVAAPYTCAGDELPRRPAPALGEDTDRILTKCGFSPERIETLRQRGVI